MNTVVQKCSGEVKKRPITYYINKGGRKNFDVFN